MNSTRHEIQMVVTFNSLSTLLILLKTTKERLGRQNVWVLSDSVSFGDDVRESAKFADMFFDRVNSYISHLHMGEMKRWCFKGGHHRLQTQGGIAI